MWYFVVSIPDLCTLTYFTLLCFFISDDKITKIYEYAHEYQIGTVMTVAEDMLCDRVENTNFIGYPITIQNTIVLLLFAEKYSMTKLTSTAVKKLSIVPSRTLRSINIYNDLTWHSKFIIADMRLQRVDPNNYLTEEK